MRALSRNTAPLRPVAAGAPLGAIEVVALALGVLWLGAAGLALWLAPVDPSASFDGLRLLLTLLALFLPPGMIWVAATAMRASRTMREESARILAAIDGLGRAHAAQSRPDGVRPARTEPQADAAPASFSSRVPLRPARAAPEPAAPRSAGTGQRALPLETPPVAVETPLATEDFIRALNFPRTAEDTDGFAALRRALRDRISAQLIQASQDVLTLLSQNGVYMDDLPPDRARPEIWRQFAQGARGRAIAALGGIHDHEALALTAARMKQDPIFRDAAHHFLRLFDRTFAGFEPTASDAEISALGDTRTARAFMLLGRVAGTFD